MAYQDGIPIRSCHGPPAASVWSAMSDGYGVSGQVISNCALVVSMSLVITLPMNHSAMLNIADHRLSRPSGKVALVPSNCDVRISIWLFKSSEFILDGLCLTFGKGGVVISGVI